MRHRVATVLCSLLLLLAAIPSVALAAEDAEDDPASRVDLSLKYYAGDNAGKIREAVYDGVRVLWEAVEPYASDVGLARFPRVDAWVFSDPDTARRVFGSCPSPWIEIFGCGKRGKFAIRLTPGRGSRLPVGLARGMTIHEAFHVVQRAILPSNAQPICLAEGSADWYGNKISDEEWGRGDWSPAAGQGWLADFLTLADLDNGLIELLGWSRSRFYGYQEAPQIYSVCTSMFDVLLKTGGGGAAYFDFLKEAGRVGWRRAFDRAFTEDMDTFGLRLVRYVETEGADFRLPAEIARDEFIQRYLHDCDYTSPSALCLS